MGRVWLQKCCLERGQEACWALSQLSARTLVLMKGCKVREVELQLCSGSGLGGAGEQSRIPHQLQALEAARNLSHSRRSQGMHGGGLNVLRKAQGAAT